MHYKSLCCLTYTPLTHNHLLVFIRVESRSSVCPNTRCSLPDMFRPHRTVLRTCSTTISPRTQLDNMTSSPTHADCSVDAVMSDGMEGTDEGEERQDGDVSLIYMFIAPWRERYSACLCAFDGHVQLSTPLFLQKHSVCSS